MSEKMVLTEDNKFDQLRNSAEKITIQSDLRRKLIGGISEEDVARYVNSIQQQFLFNENELINKIDKLKAAKEELAGEYESFKQNAAMEKAQIQEALDKAVADLSESAVKCDEKDQLLQEIDERCSAEIEKLESDKELYQQQIDILENTNTEYSDKIKELEQSNKVLGTDLMELRNQTENEHKLRLQTEQELVSKSTEAANGNETKAQLEARIASLEEQLSGSRKTAEEYCAARAEIEDQLRAEKENVRQLSEEKSSLSTRVIDIKGEISTMYKQLVNLDEQLNVSEDLKRQLEHERTRADEAEKNFAYFLQSMSGIKDKFLKDQHQLEKHVFAIEEKYKAIQSEVSGLRDNLASFCNNAGTEIDELYEAAKGMCEDL